MKLSLLALLLLLPGLAEASPRPSARAAPRAAPAAVPGDQCIAAIDAAERQHALPTQLLRSIAFVESARVDPTNGRTLPWPWTINVAGTGYFFATRDEAVAAVRDFQEKGVKSIDVGCAQVNLMYHPAAFATIEIAFDPQANAQYAARFLKSLYGRTSNWPLAAAAYHSQTAERGHSYAQKVMAIWPQAARYGGLPTAGGTVAAAAAAGPDYSMYLPEFAARLRRMDEDRARRDGAGPVIETAWATRLPASRTGASFAPAANRNTFAMRDGR